MNGPNGFHGTGRLSQPMAEINTTPMVDIMLVLLVIFIITAPLLTHSVKIDLPQTNGKPQPEKPEIISLSLNKEDKLYWNDAPISKAELPLKLAEIAKMDLQPELHLRADKETRYQILAEVMTEAQSAGVTKLGFISKTE